MHKILSVISEDQQHFRNDANYISVRCGQHVRDTLLLFRKLDVFMHFRENVVSDLQISSMGIRQYYFSYPRYVADDSAFSDSSKMAARYNGLLVHEN
jgi:hypothetical protein